MSGLDGVPGAGLLVDAERRIRAGNGRCVIVLEADIDELQGKRLAELGEMGVYESASLKRWEQAVLEVLGGQNSPSTCLYVSAFEPELSTTAYSPSTGSNSD